MSTGQWRRWWVVRAQRKAPRGGDTALAWGRESGAGRGSSKSKGREQAPSKAMVPEGLTAGEARLGGQGLLRSKLSAFGPQGATSDMGDLEQGPPPLSAQFSCL